MTCAYLIISICSLFAVSCTRNINENSFRVEDNLAEFKPQFFLSSEVPAELKEGSDDGDLTVLDISDFPKNSDVYVYELKTFDQVPTLKPIFNRTNSEMYFYIISSVGYAPGCPVEFMLRNKEANYSKVFTCVPAKIIARSQYDHAEVEAVLIDKENKNFLVTLKDFKRKEQICVYSKSYDEEIAFPLLSREFSYDPRVIGKKGGVSQISVIRENGETLTIFIPWGLEWIKYQLYKDPIDGKVKSLCDNEEFLNTNLNAKEYFQTKKGV